MPTEAYTLAPRADLSGSLSATATTLTIYASANWPTSALTQFRVLIDSEILILQGGPGLSYNILQRGAEGSTAAAHNDYAAVVEVLTPAGLTGLIDAEAAIDDGSVNINGLLFLIWRAVKQVNDGG